jgi:hypothetical protein
MPTGSPGEGVDGTTWTNSLHSRYYFRHLSPAIGIKQNILTANVTVKLNLRGGNSRLFGRLQAQGHQVGLAAPRCRSGPNAPAPSCG